MNELWMLTGVRLVTWQALLQRLVVAKRAKRRQIRLSYELSTRPSARDFWRALLVLVDEAGSYQSALDAVNAEVAHRTNQPQPIAVGQP